MRASELVKRLQENIKQFGDLEVTNEVGNLITGVDKELVIIGDGVSHFELSESCIGIDEFSASVGSYIAEGMSEEEARKVALGELEEYYS